MNQSRLILFSHSVFAVALGLSLFILNVPSPSYGKMTEGQLWDALGELWPQFLIFAVSFLVIFALWNIHQIIVNSRISLNGRSVFLSTAAFFFFVLLIPFAGQLVGHYHFLRVALFLYGVMVIGASLTLLWLGMYATDEAGKHLTETSELIALIALSLIVIVVSFLSPAASLVILFLGVLILTTTNIQDMSERIIKIVKK